ncbi:hypothetical protein, partial [Streptomyces parvus]|uniref:hypothetical protein n=1 Tax=Streptomyces parvus TaxID=66428 RepID=UPI0021018E48
MAATNFSMTFPYTCRRRSYRTVALTVGAEAPLTITLASHARSTDGLSQQALQPVPKKRLVNPLCGRTASHQLFVPKFCTHQGPLAVRLTPAPKS